MTKNRKRYYDSPNNRTEVWHRPDNNLYVVWSPASRWGICWAIRAYSDSPYLYPGIVCSEWLVMEGYQYHD